MSAPPRPQDGLDSLSDDSVSVPARPYLLRVCVLAAESLSLLRSRRPLRELLESLFTGREPLLSIGVAVARGGDRCRLLSGGALTLAWTWLVRVAVSKALPLLLLSGERVPLREGERLRFFFDAEVDAPYADLDVSAVSWGELEVGALPLGAVEGTRSQESDQSSLALFHGSAAGADGSLSCFPLIRLL